MSGADRNAPAVSTPKAAAIYARISRDKVGAGLGVARQREDCARVAEHNGWVVAEVYVDNDLSAYSGKPRPSYLRMFRDIAAGRRDGVITWHNDRLHRSPRELEDFIDLVEKTKVAVGTVTAGDYDLSTPAGRLQARVAGAVARHESEHKSERVKREIVQAAEKGIAPGGRRTYGYSAADLAKGIRTRAETIPEEAAIIRECAQRVLAGETLNGLARDLLQRGMRSTTGKPFTSIALRRILISDWVCGYRTLNGARMARGTWTPILDELTVRRLRTVLLDPKRTTPTGGRRMLTGLLICSQCGRSLYGGQPSSSRGHHRRYVCKTGAPGDRFNGCGKIGIKADDLESDVMDRVLAVIQARHLTDAIDAASPSEPQAPDTVAHIEAKLKELAVLYANDQLTAQEWMTARSGLIERLEQARALEADQARSQQVSKLTTEVAGMAHQWDTLTDEQKRLVIEAAVKSIVIGPATRGHNWYDGERVTIDWRV